MGQSTNSYHYCCAWNKTTFSKIYIKNRISNYLLEIKKFNIGKDEFIVLNKIEANVFTAKPVHGKRSYDIAYYAKEHNKESVKKFEQVVNRVESFIHKNGWKLEKKFNQG